jgi:glycosyltransferase involved in cell wall biosynthesis
MMVTISVVIPADNAERTIEKLRSSVQARTFSDFGLIVIPVNCVSTLLP